MKKLSALVQNIYNNLQQIKEYYNMLGIGQKFPDFNVKATVTTDVTTAFTDINNKSYKGKWLVVFFWPKDFTFVCPTEIAEFGKLNGEFKDRDAQVLGASTDSEFVHLAWRQNHEDLKNLPFPMLADVKRELTTALGILDPNEGVAQRATYIVDPEGIIRFVMVTDLNVGRNVKEVVRVLDALQTDELCPCNWKKGEETIDVKKVAAKGGKK
jgi:peroxiredoxin (alkyl hydroperoxide reductase subunit C)